MSVARFFKWICDGCGLVVEKSDYGFPDDWKRTDASILIGEKIRHWCLNCQAVINPKRLKDGEQ